VSSLLRRRTVLAGVVGGIIFPLISSTLGADDTRRFSVAITAGKVDKKNRTLRVDQGDKVVIIFSTDRPVDLHLHGIDKQILVVPGKLGELSFDAEVAGRFPIELHGSKAHGRLLYVEVLPR